MKGINMRTLIFTFAIVVNSFCMDSLTLYTDTTYHSNNKIDIIFSYLKIDGKILHGPYKSYYENGSIKIKGNYFLGQRERLWKFFNETGELVDEKEYENSSVKLKDNPVSTDEANKINAIKTEIEKLSDKIAYMDSNIGKELYSNKKNAIKTGGTIIGVFEILGGTLGLIFTIADANSEYKINGEKYKNEWQKMHTVCLTLSISSFFAGISSIIISQK